MSPLVGGAGSSTDSSFHAGHESCARSQNGHRGEHPGDAAGGGAHPGAAGGGGRRFASDGDEILFLNFSWSLNWSARMCVRLSLGTAGGAPDTALSNSVVQLRNEKIMCPACGGEAKRDGRTSSGRARRRCRSRGACTARRCDGTAKRPTPFAGWGSAQRGFRHGMRGWYNNGTYRRRARGAGSLEIDVLYAFRPKSLYQPCDSLHYRPVFLHAPSRRHAGSARRGQRSEAARRRFR